LIPQALLGSLLRYFNGIGAKTRVPVIAAGGTCNHIHLLVALPSDVTLAKAIQTFKANSSRWLGEHDISFAWQEGYGAFSVSSSNLAMVRKYIEHQAEHHARRSFEDEYLTLLRKCGVKYEQEHVFG
jgi:REP element-mobilizing transposase RayT